MVKFQICLRVCNSNNNDHNNNNNNNYNNNLNKVTKLHVLTETSVIFN